MLVVITAVAFDFTNGFHDTGNAMVTSIATRALPPKIAVALSGVLHLVGAFLSLSVAATIASGLVDTKLIALTVVFAGPAGGILRNLTTWFLGIQFMAAYTARVLELSAADIERCASGFAKPAGTRPETQPPSRSLAATADAGAAPGSPR